MTNNFRYYSLYFVFGNPKYFIFNYLIRSLPNVNKDEKEYLLVLCSLTNYK